MLQFGNIGQLNTLELGEIASSRGLIGAVVEGYENKTTPGDPIQMIVVDKSTIPYINSNLHHYEVNTYVGLKIKEDEFDFISAANTSDMKDMEVVYILAHQLTKIVQLPTVQ